MTAGWSRVEQGGAGGVAAFFSFTRVRKSLVVSQKTRQAGWRPRRAETSMESGDSSDNLAERENGGVGVQFNHLTHKQRGLKTSDTDTTTGTAGRGAGWIMGISA